jgi:hypothetical protein
MYVTQILRYIQHLVLYMVSFNNDKELDHITQGYRGTAVYCVYNKELPATCASKHSP